MNQRSILNVFFLLLWLTGYSQQNERPLIFPIPLEVQIGKGEFVIDESTVILLPEKVNNSDAFLEKLFLNEIADKYGQVVKTSMRRGFTNKDKFILVGDLSNPLIKSYCEQNGLVATLKNLGDEGYILSVSGNNVVVAANSRNGSLWGLSSLRQIVQKEQGKLILPQLLVKDKPQFPFRGIKLYLPGRENIPFFKRFIKDFAALYKFNKIILELNANMRLDRHPELNIGAVEFANHLKYSRLGRPPGPHQEFQNSSHQDNGDGEILEKDEVSDLVNYMRRFNIEVIPELPSLTHAYYLLAGHKELAENLNQEYPDTYCPLKPEIYKIYFDVLDEYIDVIHPSMIHVGHDEWRVEKDICLLCKGKDYGELYANDLNKIHNYLAKKGIKIAIWGDHLLESVTGKNHQVWKTSTGYEYKKPGALRPDQVSKLIPKDILIFNWFFDDINNSKKISDFGFRQVYGNLHPATYNWSDMAKLRGVLGGAPSSWAGSTEWIMGKDMLAEILGSANLLWSRQYLSVDKIGVLTQALAGEIQQNLSGKKLPGDDGGQVSPLDISSHFNSSLSEGIDSLNSSDILTGEIKKGNRIFTLNSPTNKGEKAIVATAVKEKTKTLDGIKINKDVSSILFLHASAKSASNQKAYNRIYGVDDSAELLGWYEVVYEDGFVITIPIRYGVNILDWKWKQRIMNRKDQNSNYVYGANEFECSKDHSNSITFFSFEWQNTRFGKKIMEVRLKPVNYKKGKENAIILLAVSVTENKIGVESQGVEIE